jgi:hypothetical protein
MCETLGCVLFWVMTLEFADVYLKIIFEPDVCSTTDTLEFENHCCGEGGS